MMRVCRWSSVRWLGLNKWFSFDQTRTIDDPHIIISRSRFQKNSFIINWTKELHNPSYTHVEWHCVTSRTNILNLYVYRAKLRHYSFIINFLERMINILNLAKNMHSRTLRISLVSVALASSHLFLREPFGLPYFRQELI